MNSTDRFENFTERARQVLSLALAGPFARLMERLLAKKGQQIAGAPFPSLLDPRALTAPAVAQGLATCEVLHMADIATHMFELSIQVFEESPKVIQMRIEILDDQLDKLHAGILGYLIQLDEEAMTEEQTRRDIALFTLIGDLDAIGDVITRCFMGLARRRLRGPVQFSEDGWQDLLDYHQQIQKALQQVLAALATQNLLLVTKLLSRKAELQRTKLDIRLHHIRELRADVPHSRVSSAVYLTLLDAMSDVLSHIFNIAYALQAQDAQRFVGQFRGLRLVS